MKDLVTTPLMSPPGDTILETMELKGISIEKLSDGLQLSLTETKALLYGEIAIDLFLAKSLAATLDIPTSFWMNREENYRKEVELFPETNNA